jgi:hypothetical protein|tara:strand:- start:148 stop:471 length:324 start_codon:yes stop_codon:yes gene_type:complete
MSIYDTSTMTMAGLVKDRDEPSNNLNWTQKEDKDSKYNKQNDATFPFGHEITCIVRDVIFGGHPRQQNTLLVVVVITQRDIVVYAYFEMCHSLTFSLNDTKGKGRNP